jgi:hypothetical protein
VIEYLPDPEVAANVEAAGWVPDGALETAARRGRAVLACASC